MNKWVGYSGKAMVYIWKNKKCGCNMEKVTPSGFSEDGGSHLVGVTSKAVASELGPRRWKDGRWKWGSEGFQVWVDSWVGAREGNMEDHEKHCVNKYTQRWDWDVRTPKFSNSGTEIVVYFHIHIYSISYSKRGLTEVFQAGVWQNWSSALWTSIQPSVEWLGQQGDGRWINQLWGHFNNPSKS